MTTKMKPPVGIIAGQGAGGKVFYVVADGFAYVDDDSVTSLQNSGWSKIAHQGDAFDPSNVNLTGGVIGGVPVANIVAATLNFAPQDLDIHNVCFDEPSIALLNLPSPYSPPLSNEFAYLVPVYSPPAWNGYRFWGIGAPYPGSDAQKENPCLMVSTDGENWQTAPGVVNPLFGPPAAGNYSDPSLTFSADGKALYLTFIWEGAGGAIPGGYSYAIMLSKSTDGQAWTSPQVLWGTASAASRPDSQTLMWNPVAGSWTCIYMAGAGASVQKLTAAGADPLTATWGAPSTVSITHPLGRSWWHGHFVNVSSAGAEKIIGLLEDNLSGGGTLWSASSMDGGNTFSVQPLTAYDASTAGGSWYKPSFCVIPALQPKILLLCSRISSMSAVQNSITWAVHKSLLSLDGGRIQSVIAAQRDMVNRQVTPGAGVLVYDSFNRTASPGNADSGQAWTVSSGTWSTNGSVLTPGVAANNILTVDCKSQDFYIEVKVPSLGTGSSQFWIVFNYKDNLNFYRYGTSATSAVFQKVVAGAVTAYTSGVAVWVAGDVIAVERKGAYINFYRNDLLYDSIKENSYSTSTIVGLQGTGNTTSPTFDNFICKRGRK